MAYRSSSGREGESSSYYAARSFFHTGKGNYPWSITSKDGVLGYETGAETFQCCLCGMIRKISKGYSVIYEDSYEEDVVGPCCKRLIALL